MIVFFPALSYAACTSPAAPAGRIDYTSAAGEQVFKYCNGTDWVPWAGEPVSGIPAPQYSSASGGASALNDLTDVNTAGYADGDILMYSAGASGWVAGTVSGGGDVTAQIFTASGTWTKPAGVSKIKVEVVGGGGAGRSSSVKGGGGGGVCIKLIDVTAVSSVSVTVGSGGISGGSAGGDSSFGAYCTGGGGPGGTGTGGSSGFTSGGTSSGGDINISGTGTYDGSGGDSVYGSYGHGGDASSTNNKTGGSGIVIVWEYYGGGSGGGGSTSPGGSDTQVQFNDGGSFGGDANLIWDKTNNYLGINTTPTVALDVVGDIHYTGVITDVSDLRMKYDIHPLDSPLKKLTSLNGFSFKMKGDPKQQIEYGVAAQDVQKVFPELVHQVRPDGTMGVAYDGLIAPMIESIKELKAENDALRARVEALEQQQKQQQIREQ